MVDTVRTLSTLQGLLADNTAGDVSAQDVRDFLVSVFPNQYSAARVRQITTAQTLVDTTLTAVTFNTEDLDTDTYHDNSTDNTRLTVPTSGLYWVHGGVEFGPRTDYVYLTLGIREGGANYKTFTNVPAISSVSVSGSVETATIVSLTAGQYVELMARQRNGAAATLPLVLGGGTAGPRFEIFRIGQAPA